MPISNYADRYFPEPNQIKPQLILSQEQIQTLVVEIQNALKEIQIGDATYSAVVSPITEGDLYITIDTSNPLLGQVVAESDETKKEDPTSKRDEWEDVTDLSDLVFASVNKVVERLFLQGNNRSGIHPDRILEYGLQIQTQVRNPDQSIKGLSEIEYRFKVGLKDQSLSILDQLGEA